MISNQARAAKRAFDHWDMGGDEDEYMRHIRFMYQIDRLIDPTIKPEPHAPITHYWRRRLNHHQNDMRRASCNYCKGTGEITFSDGYGCIEIDACPACQRAYTGERIAGDVSAF